MKEAANCHAPNMRPINNVPIMRHTVAAVATTVSVRRIMTAVGHYTLAAVTGAIIDMRQ